MSKKTKLSSIVQDISRVSVVVIDDSKERVSGNYEQSSFSNEKVLRRRGPQRDVLSICRICAR